MKIRVGTISTVLFFVMAIFLAFGILPMTLYTAGVLIFSAIAGFLGLWLDF